MTLVRSARLACALLLVVELCGAANLNDRAAELRKAVKTFDMRLQVTTSHDSREDCGRVLSYLISPSRASILPVAAANSLDAPALAAFANRCPGLDLGAWKSSDGLTYRATDSFRIFALPPRINHLDGGAHFLLFAQSYFNGDVKELYRANPKIYDHGGFAWPDGAGGGAIYSLVDTESCSFDTQLVVSGEFDHTRGLGTPHFSEPFVFDKKLYIFDYHNLRDAAHNYAGLVVWALDQPQRPHQACVYDSTDSRALLKGAAVSPNNSLEQTRDK